MGKTWGLRTAMMKYIYNEIIRPMMRRIKIEQGESRNISDHRSEADLSLYYRGYDHDTDRDNRDHARAFAH